jgi:nitroreductase
LLIVPFAHEEAYVARYRAPEKASVGRHSGADFPAPYWFIDTAFATMLILLSSIDAGLGAFYFSIGPTNKEIPMFRQKLKIPDDYYPIGAIAIGYTSKDDQPGPVAETLKRRRSSSALIHLNKW